MPHSDFHHSDGQSGKTASQERWVESIPMYYEQQCVIYLPATDDIQALKMFRHYSADSAESPLVTSTNAELGTLIRGLNSFRRRDSAKVAWLDEHWFMKGWFSGWRGGMLMSLFLAAFVLTLEITFLIVAVTVYGATGGPVGTLYEGSCSQAETLAPVSHLIINIRGTLLLAASNYTMQILAAPTRQEVDAGHKKSRYVLVGDYVAADIIRGSRRNQPSRAKQTNRRHAINRHTFSPVGIPKVEATSRTAAAAWRVDPVVVGYVDTTGSSRPATAEWESRAPRFASATSQSV
ncbi:hypothetical protein B0J12DRAFT_663314 [Macrophomina phaseolina]|uniref:DUF6536 domain-containing protein n=1 Tax=Macrophomina phaseolina TaxID=35725 RepID=A0ABQ8GAL4_9PEZI|nr:hypothetical protein B0J12DRAFT_663314 [Macrophomina phaseolina]